MKRSHFTRKELKQLAKNYTLYKVRIRSGKFEFDERTNSEDIVMYLTKPYMIGETRNTDDPWYLLALSYNNWAYGFYDLEDWGPQFEWVHLKDLQPYVHSYEYDLYFEKCLEDERALEAQECKQKSLEK